MRLLPRGALARRQNLRAECATVGVWLTALLSMEILGRGSRSPLALHSHVQPAMATASHSRSAPWVVHDSRGLQIGPALPSLPAGTCGAATILTTPPEWPSALVCESGSVISPRSHGAQTAPHHLWPGSLRHGRGWSMVREFRPRFFWEERSELVDSSRASLEELG